ncbi:hypothetical protein [Ferrimicrobium sp.]|uniref:hypothetical protein n=1 Tax=Ferrimicrobium sp. TaxID=2926050 RepID=UPI002604A410|nr:hypothetical protein [Ferrimicrobium sp.]
MKVYRVSQGISGTGGWRQGARVVHVRALCTRQAGLQGAVGRDIGTAPRVGAMALGPNMARAESGVMTFS